MHRPAPLNAILLAPILAAVLPWVVAAADWVPRPIEQPALPNAQWVTDNVISGGSPVGDAGFAALERLGVRTIISVDGAAPEVDLAKRHGLRYVHLPHGYDGVPAARAVELAKAVRDLPGPIYIHCHHGKHRSPAAAAVACVGAGTLPATDADAVLLAAGTSPHYRGLFQSAERAATIPTVQLDAAQSDFPELAAAPPLVEAMVAIEHTHDNLLAIEKAGWQAPDKHPDLDPAHEALLLREHYAELPRTVALAAHPAEFWAAVRNSNKLARKLEAALQTPFPDPKAAAAALAEVTADCKSCHARHRDVPLGEK